ncbi:hypothetical protein AB0I28_15380 [Phytomonospora sp. NPDC050363]|uniref:hypothetical protein n=1 Tax=Phytomonospora sp. NPDC050363 TaxID=3155642 RepID=UPI0033EB752A
MFVTVQIPVVDLRPLIAAPTGRDELPVWPRPDRAYSRWSADHYRSNYVRGLGPVRPRLRGGAAPWLSESVYIDVSRNVRMERSHVGPSGAHWAEWTTMRPVYRNFYTDGVVGRFEACLKISGFGAPVSRELLEEAATSAPVWLRGLSQRRRPLAQFGPVLTRHLLRCTTAGEGPDPQSWWLQAATPGVITEAPLEDPRAGGHLAQDWVLRGGVRMSSWAITQDADGDADAARRLRIHVSRLHADFMAAEIVAGLCQGGRLDPDHPPVRRYLARTIDLLLRPARHGYSQADLLVKVLSGNTEAAYAGTFAALKRLDSLTERSERIGELLDGVKPTRRGGIVLRVKELVMAKGERTVEPPRG